MVEMVEVLMSEAVVFQRVETVFNLDKSSLEIFTLMGNWWANSKSTSYRNLLVVSSFHWKLYQTYHK